MSAGTAPGGTAGSGTAPPADDAARHGVPPLRRDRRLQAWLAAMAVSVAGDSVFTIGFAWAAVQVASPAVAGFVVGAAMLPQAAFLLLGGALADRLETRRVLAVCSLLRVVTLLAGALLWSSGASPVPVLLGVALVFGTADAVYHPANATLPRQLVRPEDLGRVAGTQQVVRRLAVFTGAGVGGWLAAAHGLTAAMLVDAGCFAVVGVVVWWVARPRFPVSRETTGSVLRGLAEGAAYVRRDARARRFVVTLSGLNLFVGPALAVGVALRVSDSGWSAGLLGAVEATVGVAAAGGALLAMRWAPARDAYAGFVLLVAQGCGIACLGVPAVPVVLAGAALVGLTAGGASTLLGGAFQRTIDPAYLGRTSSMTTLSDYALMPAMMPLFGWLAHVASVTWAAGLFGAGMVLLCAWGAWGARSDGPSGTAQEANAARTSSSVSP